MVVCVLLCERESSCFVVGAVLLLSGLDPDGDGPFPGYKGGHSK